LHKLIWDLIWIGERWIKKRKRMAGKETLEPDSKNHKLMLLKGVIIVTPKD
jgi:hypothetical protein